MISYVENPKEYTHTHTLLQLINKFKVTEYNIDTLKSVVILYASNEQSEKEIKKTIPFKIASKRLKYLE